MVKRISLLPYFITVFIDLLGIGIIIPILAPIFISQNSTLVTQQTPLIVRTLLLGLLIGSYPLAQFLGAPILGTLSDHWGRRKIILISLLGTCIGYMLFATGIQFSLIWLLFLSRFLSGFTGGNISAVMSAIADITKPEERAKSFGIIGMAFGIGFILGPYIAGKLSDPNIVPWFNFATPFIFATLLTIVNILLVYFKVPETLKKPVKSEISIFAGVNNIRRAFAIEKLRAVFIVMFLLMFGFSFFAQFFQVYLIEQFDYTQGQIGDMFAYIGIWVALTQGIGVRILAKYISSKRILVYSILLFGFSLFILLLPQKSYLFLIVLPLIAIFNGITQPNLTSVVSSLADEKSQGEVMGINQSLAALAQAIPPIFSGFLAAIDTRLPIVTSGVIILIAWFIYFNYFYKVNRQEVFQEK
ncbi:MFS transporter [Candidatus Gottesmanbacteria bacterium]|nr:MFS transporter [Candidatus Gottesmanbacteria bacterium]